MAYYSPASRQARDSAILKGKLVGVEAALSKLAAIKFAMRNRISRLAVARAARPLVRAVRDALPERSGWLKQSQAAKVTTYRNSGVTVLIVGARTKHPSPQGEIPTKIMHFAEDGRKAVIATGRALKIHNENGWEYRRSAAAVPAHPVMAAAIEKTRSEVMQILETEIAKGIERYT